MRLAQRESGSARQFQKLAGIGSCNGKRRGNQGRGSQTFTRLCLEGDRKEKCKSFGNVGGKEMSGTASKGGYNQGVVISRSEGRLGENWRGGVPNGIGRADTEHKKEMTKVISPGRQRPNPISTTTNNGGGEKKKDTGTEKIPPDDRNLNNKVAVSGDGRHRCRS